jgi:3'-phosphoadenosine 5'-phosphosulfate sulfotransferase (PAPS reductase)/FAD synthetase
VYAVVADHRLGLPYWEAVARYGWPAPLERWGGGKRWCCAHFKANWLAERHPNGVYEGRPARFLAVGIRRQESHYRARLWAGRTWQVFENRDGTVDVALAPIVDLSEADVWALLSHYGLRDAVRPQYERWGRAPNCALCPLMGRSAVERAAERLPTGYLEAVARTLRRILPRYGGSTLARRRIEEWLKIIEAELGRRRTEG